MTRRPATQRAPALRVLIATGFLLWAIAAGSLRAAEEIESIEIPVGELVFDALAAGPEDGELVLLLHGFPQSGHSYRHQLRALAQAGYRAVAPDQRGYSPGARPSEVEAYGMIHLVGDVVGIALSLGRQQFHLVGHDWGGAVAWATASFQPQRVLSLTVLSTPHYLALSQSYADPDSDQSQRSSYFSDFAAPGAEARFLADDKAMFRGILQGTGAPAEDLDVYLDRLGTPEAMGAALNWYRALIASRAAGSGSPGAGGPPPRIQARTLYLFGTEDSAFGLAPARATAGYIAAPYEFHVLDGSGHWLPEEAADTVSRLLVNHVQQTSTDLAADPVDRHFDPETRIFSSTAEPGFELTIPDDYLYLGRLTFPLNGIAWVDRHFFARLDGNTVERAIVLQFEQMLEGHEGSYSFGVPPDDQRAGGNFRFSPERVDLGSHSYVHNTWAFDQRESASQQPGAESDRMLRYLGGRGLEIDDALIMSRFVRAVGPEQRHELILFYLEPLAARGYSLGEFPDGGPVSSRYDALSSEVTGESLAIFGTLRDRP